MSEKEAEAPGKEEGSKVSPVSLLLSSQEKENVDGNNDTGLTLLPSSFPGASASFSLMVYSASVAVQAHYLPVSIQVPPSRTTHRSPSTSSTDGAGAPPAPECDDSNNDTGLTLLPSSFPGASASFSLMVYSASVGTGGR
jgi:hypothetical protein